ncbi:hypothetical protein [Citrobacter portucalensis]|uniref:hypothetical protein n=1 Tax=Citrobacter portucalensis TaxID=1639133 RepID=UPI002889E5ED|nr:hypothetical protein [Citrobacter portucalensis]WNI88045.1 hypothetical protein RIK60_09875 [Citrobacter portucalensis]
MPRDIQINSFQQSPVDGVLIERRTVQNNLYFKRLEKQARQCAKQVIKEAQNDAMILRQQACQEGFQQGVLDAFQHIVSHLSTGHAVMESWQKKIDVYILEVLSKAVEHPDSLILVLDEWLNECPKKDISINITLPESAKKWHEKVMARLTDENITVIHIDYHVEPRFVFRSGDLIAEFSPCEFIETAGRSIHVKYATALLNDYKYLSQTALNEFIEHCKNTDFVVGERDNATIE